MRLKVLSQFVTLLTAIAFAYLVFIWQQAPVWSLAMQPGQRFVMHPSRDEFSIIEFYRSDIAATITRYLTTSKTPTPVSRVSVSNPSVGEGFTRLPYHIQQHRLMIQDLDANNNRLMVNVFDFSGKHLASKLLENASYAIVAAGGKTLRVSEPNRSHRLLNLDSGDVFYSGKSRLGQRGIFSEDRQFQFRYEVKPDVVELTIQDLSTGSTTKPVMVPNDFTPEAIRLVGKPIEPIITIQEQAEHGTFSLSQSINWGGTVPIELKGIKATERWFKHERDQITSIPALVPPLNTFPKAGILYQDHQSLTNQLVLKLTVFDGRPRLVESARNCVAVFGMERRFDELLGTYSAPNRCLHEILTADRTNSTGPQTYTKVAQWTDKHEDQVFAIPHNEIAIAELSDGKIVAFRTSHGLLSRFVPGLVGLFIWLGIQILLRIRSRLRSSGQLATATKAD